MGSLGWGPERSGINRVKPFCHSAAWKSRPVTTAKSTLFSLSPSEPSTTTDNLYPVRRKCHHHPSSTQNGPSSREMLPLLQEQGACRFRFRELLKICAGYLGGGECASIHHRRPPRHDRNIAFAVRSDLYSTVPVHLLNFFFKMGGFADISLQHPALPQVPVQPWCSRP